MKRKDYRKPTTQVVKLQHHGMLMESGVGASRNGYGSANTDTWGDGSANTDTWGDGGSGANARGNYVDWDND